MKIALIYFIYHLDELEIESARILIYLKVTIFILARLRKNFINLKTT